MEIISSIGDFGIYPGTKVIVCSDFPMYGWRITPDLIGKIGVVTSVNLGSATFAHVFFSPAQTEYIYIGNLAPIEE